MARREKRTEEPYGWIDDTELRRAEHPLAVVARAVAVLEAVVSVDHDRRDKGRIFEGLAAAIVALAKHSDYGALGWLLYGLEEMVDEDRREEWPLSGSDSDVPEAFKAAEA